MASNITLAIGGSRRMTYTEPTEARNISTPAARRLTLRQQWHWQIGNDGIAIVSVPLLALGKRSKSGFRDTTSRHSDETGAARSVSVRDAWSDAGSDRPRHYADFSDSRARTCDRGAVGVTEPRRAAGHYAACQTGRAAGCRAKGDRSSEVRDSRGLRWTLSRRR